MEAKVTTRKNVKLKPVPQTAPLPESETPVSLDELRILRKRLDADTALLLSLIDRIRLSGLDHIDPSKRWDVVMGLGGLLHSVGEFIDTYSLNASVKSQKVNPKRAINDDVESTAKTIAASNER